MPAPSPTHPQPDPSGSAPQAPVSARPAGHRIPPLAWLWGTALVVLAVDQLTKIWAVAALTGAGRTAVIGDLLGLVLVRNPGAAFSLATGQTWIFTIVAAVVIAVVVRVSRRLASTTWAVALGLVLGGAVGNLVDRLVRSPGLFRGHVVDFIDYGGRFVGNAADIAIVAAAVLIVALSLRGTELDGSRPGASQSTVQPAPAASTELADAGDAPDQGDAVASALAERRQARQDMGAAPGQGEAAALGREEQA